MNPQRTRDNMPEILRADIEDMYGDIEHFMRMLYSPAMLCIFRNNGYIAGGFPRMLLENGRIYNNYFAQLGDIDVFFRKHDDYLAALDDLKAHVAYAHHISPSLAGFATNVDIPRERLCIRESPNQVKIQLISTYFDEPEAMLKRFDLTNSMVAFDLSHGYVADGWRDLREKKTLEVSRFDNYENDEMLGQRVGKYIERYGYNNLTPRSKEHFVQWYRRYRKYRNDNRKSLSISRVRSETSTPQAWPGMSRVMHVVVNGNLPLEVIPEFVGVGRYKNPYIASGDAMAIAHGYRCVDSAVLALKQRNAPRHIIDRLSDHVQSEQQATGIRRTLEHLHMLDV